jgi:hypothetical protein
MKGALTRRGPLADLMYGERRQHSLWASLRPPPKKDRALAGSSNRTTASRPGGSMWPAFPTLGRTDVSLFTMCHEVQVQVRKEGAGL